MSFTWWLTDQLNQIDTNHISHIGLFMRFQNKSPHLDLQQWHRKLLSLLIMHTSPALLIILINISVYNPYLNCCLYYIIHKDVFLLNRGFF